MEGCGEREGEGREKGWREEWTASCPNMTQQRCLCFINLTVWLYCLPVHVLFVFSVVLIFLSSVRKHKCVMCFLWDRKRESERERICIWFFSWSSISHFALICAYFLQCVYVCVCVCKHVCVCLCYVSLLFMVSLFIMVPVWRYLSGSVLIKREELD